jgi:hypothetical protein
MKGDILMGQVLDTNTEQKIIERLNSLHPQQLDEVIDFIDFIVERGQKNTSFFEAVEMKHSIIALRGRGKGEHLVERLLQSRREDKRHDERKREKLCS